MRIILATAIALGLALPANAERGSEFPVDSPTVPETPAQRRERQYQERFNKADAQRIRKAQNDYDKRQREYQREENKLKSSEAEKEKNRKDSEEDGIYRNQVTYEILKGQYIRRLPKAKQLDPNAFVKPKKKLTVKEQREMEKFLNLFPDEKK